MKWLPSGFDGEAIRPLLPAPSEGPELVLGVFGFAIAVQVRLRVAGDLLVEGVQMLRVVVDRDARAPRPRHDSPRFLREGSRSSLSRGQPAWDRRRDASSTGFTDPSS